MQVAVKYTKKETGTDEHKSEKSTDFMADVACDGTQTPDLKTTETRTQAGLIISEAPTQIDPITSEAFTQIDPITSEASTQIDLITPEAAVQTDSR